MLNVKNPILSGFYPDPSICRVGEDFYLVNSTFAYFPGVPIFHSKDLANWTQIGNILDRNSQLPLEKARHSGGIFAPTIRYHNGTYYMITTNVGHGGNFIVTAKNPEGPWSEPYYLKTPGIDPSLFFDEDGTCYYIGTRPNTNGEKYGGDWEIWIQVLDLETMTLIGDTYTVWNGAMRDVIWPEGPHLYKKDGYYYIMIAEGGTGPDHAVTIARSKEVFGPYKGNPKNPILTHRHLGKDYPVVYVGHGDLVDDKDGNWYMVTLASRRCEGYIGLGRETFLTKVVWEDGWPVVNPGIGKLEEVVELPYHGETVNKNKNQSLIPFTSDFHDVLKLRNVKKEFYEIAEDGVKLNILPYTLTELESPAYLGFRQLEYQYEAKANLSLRELKGKEEIGLAIVQSNEYHMLFCIKASEGDAKMQVVKVIKGERILIAQKTIKNFFVNQLDALAQMNLLIKGYGQKADFIYEADEEKTLLAKEVDIHEMSTEIAGGFVGNTIGIYASSNGEESQNQVYVNKFTISY